MVTSRRASEKGSDQRRLTVFLAQVRNRFWARIIRRVPSVPPSRLLAVGRARWRALELQSVLAGCTHKACSARTSAGLSQVRFCNWYTQCITRAANRDRDLGCSGNQTEQALLSDRSIPSRSQAHTVTSTMVLTNPSSMLTLIRMSVFSAQHGPAFFDGRTPRLRVGLRIIN